METVWQAVHRPSPSHDLSNLVSNRPVFQQHVHIQEAWCSCTVVSIIIRCYTNTPIHIQDVLPSWTTIGFNHHKMLPLSTWLWWSLRHDSFHCLPLWILFDKSTRTFILDALGLDFASLWFLLASLRRSLARMASRWIGAVGSLYFFFIIIIIFISRVTKKLGAVTSLWHWTSQDLRLLSRLRSRAPKIQINNVQQRLWNYW